MSKTKFNRCEDKRTFSTKGEAGDAVKGLAKAGRGRMRAYKCDKCGQYHLSTVGRKRFRK